MKKWFVGLLMMAMALVMIPSVVMAETEVSFYCPSCCEQRTGIKSDTYEYFDQNTHIQRITCKVCNYKGMSVSSAHTETKAATCQSAAYCADCKSYYGSKAEHNWSAWSKSDENQHVRTCQTSGCDAVEYAAHTGGSPTCTTAATCADCNVPYYDETNHEGERKTTYAIDPEDEIRHIVMQTCAGCRAVLSTVSEGHTTDKLATCMNGMHCKICDLYYGATVDHVMSRWLPADDGQRHYRACEYGCGKTEYGKHNVSSPATCAFPAYCKDCGHFGDVDADAHDWSAWKLYDTDQHYRYCRKNKTAHVEYADHTGGTATCETRAMCDVCDEYYGQILDHDYVMHDAQAATCTEIGWDAYETCSRCDYSTYAETPALGHDIVKHDAQAPTCTAIGWEAYDTCSHCDYTTYVELPALGHDYQAKIIPRTCEDDGYTLHTCTRCADRYADTIVPHCGHWYGEWTANGDGTQRAECLRGGCHHEKTVDCEIIELPALNISLCPVCGTASDGSRLALTNASVKIVSGRIPHGEALLRVGTLANGEKLLTVGYVYGGQLSKASCQVKITLPAGLLEGYALCLLSEDGTEAELTLDVQEDTVSFVIDYTDSLDTVKVLHLVPAV